MKKIIFSLLIVGALASCGGNEEKSENKEGYTTIEGASFPTELSIDSTKLVLNGVGLRKFLFIKVYVAGLYLPKKNRDEIVVIDADEPSVLRLHAISRAFTSERMANTVREQFEKSNKGHTAELQTRIDILCNRLAQETIELGDECDISYTPDEGIRFAKNGKDLNILLSGLDFKKALWNNFLGENPAEEGLKKGLLGL